jgi:hypothetical protein
MPLAETQLLQSLIASLKPDPALFECVMQPKQSHIVIQCGSVVLRLCESE